VKLFLVDGTFELFRAFYSAPSRTSPAGQEVGALAFLMRNLARLFDEPGFTHAAVAFDHVIESFRNDLFPGYKTGAGIDPKLYQQFEGAERMSRALGFCTWPMVEFEADDAVATAIHRFHEEPALEGIVVCSPDKDFAQCLTYPGVTLLDRVRNRSLNRASASEKFGVSPEAIPDYLALVGDTADGIPGIPRWGEKSAATVLAYYKALEAIPADVDQWRVSVRGAAALSRELEARRPESILYRTLATLRTDVPLTESFEELRHRGVNTAQLASLCEELGFSMPSFARETDVSKT
jgi:5'-3' exonuclease